MWVIVFRGANIRVSHGRDEKQNVNAYNNQVVYISIRRGHCSYMELSHYNVFEKHTHSVWKS